MKIDWKALRQQKLEELPAAEIARQKREDKLNRHIERITNTVEKNLYKACKYQEAGIPVEHCILDGMNKFVTFFQVVNGDHWTWDVEIKNKVFSNLLTRLHDAGIKVKAVEGEYSVLITLP